MKVQENLQIQKKDLFFEKKINANKKDKNKKVKNKKNKKDLFFEILGEKKNVRNQSLKKSFPQLFFRKFSKFCQKF